MSMVVVTFALPHGGTHSQRIKADPYAPTHETVSRAVAAAKRKGITVANVLSMRERGEETWSCMDLGRHFR